MAILQSTIPEIRYIKRQNLEQEAKILGNMYRDQIHSYGIDCLYYKLDKTLMHNYTNIVDENNILFNAYGYDHNPQYNTQLSTHMIVYMEVENDIFNLNKYGLVPNADVTFVFDRIEFACRMAPKFGQYVEYELSDIQINDIYDLNEQQYSNIEYETNIYQTINFTTISADISAKIEDFTFGEHEVLCNIINNKNTIVKTEFPINNEIYKSFLYEIINENDIFSCFKLKYFIDENNILTIQNISGSFLFYDLVKLNKYYELLHPDVGDIITIDFPDGKNREQYEITEAIDKSLATDGINALLHKYIWKCKARRYINSHENMEKNEANDRLDEILNYDSTVKEELIKKISKYDNNEDDVYGGYDNNNINYDKQIANTHQNNIPYIDQSQLEVIIKFKAGSIIATDGYDIWFINANNETIQLSFNDISDKNKDFTTNHSNIEWLKANDDNLIFNSLDGKSCMLAMNEQATPAEQQICLNSLFDLTFTSEPLKNANDQNFYKFKNCRTVLFATKTSLFCHLANGKTYKLA